MEQAERKEIIGVVERVFPSLQFEPTSEPCNKYNCIAWAVDSFNMSQWWWPNGPRTRAGGRFWPDGCPEDDAVGAFVASLETLGYTQCLNKLFEPGFEKIALYSRPEFPEDKVTHAAVLLEDGSWSSKLGHYADIAHIGLDGLCGIKPAYGQLYCLMKRQSRR